MTDRERKVWGESQWTPAEMAAFFVEDAKPTQINKLPKVIEADNARIQPRPV